MVNPLGFLDLEKVAVSGAGDVRSEADQNRFARTGIARSYLVLGGAGSKLSRGRTLPGECNRFLQAGDALFCEQGLVTAGIRRLRAALGTSALERAATGAG